MSIKISVKRVRASNDPLPLPRYMTSGAAGVDPMADVEEDLTLAPGARALIPTGLALEIPSGHEAQIRPRSGLAIRHGITLLNSPGTIDSDYRGEVQVILANLGDQPFTIRRGDRIAQMVFAAVAHAELIEIDELGGTTRGQGGFGHTG